MENMPHSKSAIKESSNNRLLILSLSCLMGVIGGLFAAVLRFLIEIISYFFTEILLPHISLVIQDYNLGYLLLPTIGGLIVGIIISKFSKEVQGSGIPYLLESMTFKSAKISPRVGLFKTIATSISIGTGGSAGKEGPIALIAASFGSFFGGKLSLRPENKRLLMTCGLAAGIAGTFGAPAGGALFGLEILYQGITLSAGIPVFLAAVIGSVVTGLFYGYDNIFAVDFDPSSIKIAEYPIFILLGVFCAIVAYLHIFSYKKISRLFHKMKIPLFIKPAIGGLLVGLLIMFYPDSGLYGTGFNGIQQAFDENLALGMLVILLILKILASSATIGSGGSGGVFAPLVYIGCMAGGAFGTAGNSLFPSLISTPALYCILGSAAVFSASAQAPLNISLIIAEMTGHFDVFPPLIVTSISSYYVGRIFFKGSSIYTLILGRKGHHLKADTIYLLGTTQVHEIMSTNLVTVSSSIKISDFAQLSNQYHPLNKFPVVDFGNLKGIAFIDDINKIPYNSWESTTIKSIMRTEHTIISAKATLQEAMDRMNQYNLRALVVAEKIEGTDKYNLQGLVTFNDIISVWQKERKK
ncbi:MAG: chloride channel protein [Promethearchaeota archaeon]